MWCFKDFFKIRIQDNLTAFATSGKKEYSSLGKMVHFQPKDQNPDSIAKFLVTWYPTYWCWRSKDESEMASCVITKSKGVTKQGFCKIL